MLHEGRQAESSTADADILVREDLLVVLNKRSANKLEPFQRHYENLGRDRGEVTFPETTKK